MILSCQARRAQHSAAAQQRRQQRLRQHSSLVGNFFTQLTTNGAFIDFTTRTGWPESEQQAETWAEEGAEAEAQLEPGPIKS